MQGGNEGGVKHHPQCCDLDDGSVEDTKENTQENA